MYWVCTCLGTGILISIGWRIGGLVYEWLRSRITKIMNNLEMDSSYKKQVKRNGKTYYTVERKGR